MNQSIDAKQGSLLHESPNQPAPGTLHANRWREDIMAGVRGKTQQVGRDIVEFLEAVAAYFNITIVVTSGYRSTEAQAEAMFKYWKKLERGKVYSKKALPETDRKKLDDFFRTCFEDDKSTALEQSEAKAGFLKLAKTRGPQSKHLTGRAVDIAQSSLSLGAYQIISRKMRVVREGRRRDIYHFESEFPIARVTEAEKQSWGIRIPSACTLFPVASDAAIDDGCLECG